MEAVRILKRQIRRYPALMALLQPPIVKATVAFRRLQLLRWYGGRRLSIDQMGSWIRRRILERTPSALGKLGTLEVELLVHDAGRTRAGARPPVPKELREQAFLNVGIFPPDDETLWKAIDTIRASLRSLDGIGVNGQLGEQRIIREDCQNVEALSETGGLEPWHASAPWSAALAGKRVLVVHPFVRSIEAQFMRARQDIWRARPDMLPAFELDLLRVPLSAALVPPADSDWLARLDRLRSEMERRQFDVALIGAGGMSLPLAAHAKALGNIGIHLGGSTQLLFGIRGRRWDEQPQFAALFNEAWVRPSADETPPLLERVENGCYW